MTRTSIALFFLCLPWTTGRAQTASPYISHVYEYRPAPGQFTNDMPAYDAGDTDEDMRRKAEECLADNAKELVSLGGYGGYIVFGFDHEVENVAGQSDFKILGNAFYANANPNPGASREGGSCEPGIVMVSRDENGNGQPDDQWYELAGSEYHQPETIHHYEITYYRPDENKPRTPDMSYPALNDTTYIRWTTNGHGNGYLYRNVYHPQPYYPQWIADESMVFTGTKLANNYVDESGNGRYYVQYAYPLGYADNHPNNDRRSNFDIGWAIDTVGHPVHLSGIQFVKVYTGVNQYCGWLGETSTEILGAQDLHLLPWIGGWDSVEEVKVEASVELLSNPVAHRLIFRSKTPQRIVLYDLSGAKRMEFALQPGINTLPCERLAAGVYLWKGTGARGRLVKR
jgi:hypothetical protein